MPKDPSGHYKGNRYDPEYAARKKWRKNQWGAQPAAPMPYLPYDMAMMAYPGLPGMAPDPAGNGSGGGGGGGLPYGGDGGEDTQTFRGAAAVSPVRNGGPGTMAYGRLPGDKTHDHASSSHFTVYSPSHPVSRPMRASSHSDIDMGSPRRTVAERLSSPLPPKDAPPPPTPHPSHLPPPTPSSSAAVAAAAAAVAPHPPLAAPTGELSSLERLKLFKAQVEASRRSKQAAAAAAQEKQPEPAVAAELFLLSAAGGAQANGVSAEPSGSTAPVPQHTDLETSSQAEAGPAHSTPVATAPATPVASAPSPHPQTPIAPDIGTEEGEIPDTRGARQLALREKLRLKLAQKAAMEGSAESPPMTPAAPAAVSKVSTPIVAATSSVEPLRARSRNQPPRSDIPPGVSFAEAARQRFASRAEERERRKVNGRVPTRDRERDSRRNSFSTSRNPSPTRPSRSPVRRSPPPPPREQPPPPPARIPHDGRDPSVMPEQLGRRGSSHDVRSDTGPPERVATCVPFPNAADSTSAPAITQERVRDVLAMPPPYRVPQTDPVTRPMAVVDRDEPVPSATNTMETWALNQVQLLKQQQEGIARQIAEMEKLLKSGVLRTATPAVPPTPVTAPLYMGQTQPGTRHRKSSSVSPVRGGYRTPRDRDDGLSLPSREQSPYSVAAGSSIYGEPVGERGRERVRASPSYGNPYGAKEYDNGEYRAPPRKHGSYGKAPPYKAYPKPAYKPYDKRHLYDEYDRAPRYVAASAGRMERTPSGDRAAYKRYDAGFRY